MEKVMIGVDEIMQKMGIGRNRAYDIIRKKELPTIRVGRRYLIHNDVFDSWLRGEYKSKSK